jgi:ferrous iron transport protein B
VIESLQIEKTNELNQIEINRLSAQQEYSFIGRIGYFIEPALLPLGFDWKMGVSLLAGIAGKEIVVSTLGVLNQTDITADDDTKKLSYKLKTSTFSHPSKKGQKVFTPVSAFAFLTFILIYFPCIAVIAAIRKESGGWKWALFTAIYTTTLAYLVSFFIYQIGNLIV